ncbi:MAG: choice-of-anchor D domain-containing protein [bacterium]
MKYRCICFSIYFFFLSNVFCYSHNIKSKKIIFIKNGTNWVQTNGPGGGFINDIVISLDNPLIIYAIGSSAGFYKSINGGENWELIEFPDQGHASDLEISNGNPLTLFCNYHNLSKSIDGGQTWQNCAENFEEIVSAKIIKIDPLNPNNIYIAGKRYDGEGVEIYKSKDNGDSWANITGNISAPRNSDISSLALAGDGKVFIGVNDCELMTWHKGKVFYTSEDGIDWQEINFGQTGDRFIWSILVNQQKLDQIWISEGPLYNEGIPMPWLYCSENGGINWKSIYPDVGLDATQIRVLGNSNDGNKIYLAGGGDLSYTDNVGKSFYQINLPEEIMRFDLWNIAPHPDNSNVIFLPTGSGGVAFTNDNGSSWLQKNEGILATSINLLSSDPHDPSRIYCASWIGEGIFRSDDYGKNWKFLNKGGIVHPWDDELLVDPIDPRNVWYIADVPYIHKSSDYGETWHVLNHPYQKNTFNFGSIYAMGQSTNNKSFYALNNGFGIFKGARTGNDESFDWRFLNQSEIDYTYSLAVSENNSNIIFSGYSRKPFETKAKIRGSVDGGDTWFTSLEINSAEAVTSIVIDNNDPDHLYAASVGENGGILWESHDQGRNWNILNDFFNFTTIHSFAIGNTDSAIAYAGVWGGGTYRTDNAGLTWQKLEGDESFSAAAIAVNPHDANIVYLADRTQPIVYKSIDGGHSWSEFFHADSEYRRIMFVTVDPGNTNCIYVSAMKREGPGKLGGLFQIDAGVVTDIIGSIPKVPITITIDPKNSDILYLVLHENGVYKSIDSGNSWTDISIASSNLPESGFNNLLIDPKNSDILYLIGGCDVRFSTFQSAGLDNNIVNGVYRSSDAGITWENINRGVLGAQSGGIKSLVFYNNNSDIMYLGTENGVYFTTNGGNSWEKSSGIPYNTLGGIAISQERVYGFTNGAGLFMGIIQSDKSIKWDTDTKIKAPVYFAQILKDRADDSVIYASGYPGGIFKSIDNGATWHEKNFGMVSFKVDDPLRQGYYAFAQSRSNSQILYLGLFEKGVYRSENSGDTWYPVNGQAGELFNKKITGLAIDNQDENIVYIATDEGVFITNDGGQNWNSINNGLASLDVKTIYMSPTNQLFAGTRGYGLYQYVNNSWMGHNGFGNWGVIWPIWNDRPMYQYSSLLIHPFDNSRMILGTFPQGIYRSNDQGQTWIESNIGWTNDGVFSLICHPENPEIVFAGTYNGMNRSTDFGEHWEMWDHGWPPEQWVFSIDFDPTDPNVMYACSKNGENEGTGSELFNGTVMKSINGGTNWVAITSGLNINQEFYKIIVDKHNPDILYLATQHEGIFISYDCGNHWQTWNDGLTNLVSGTNGNNVTNTLILSADGLYLYFGSAGSGVFRRPTETNTNCKISVTPLSYDFGSINIGSSSDIQTFTVSNTGTLDLMLSSFSIEGINASEFYIQNDNCSGQTVSPLESYTAGVIFSPTSTGSKSAILTIESNDPTIPQLEIPVSANGLLRAVAPIVTATFATSVTSNSAILKGTINPNDSIINYYFEYGTTINYSIKIGEANMEAENVEVLASYNLTGLSENTIYHFRLVATNNSGTSYSDDVIFTTLDDSNISAKSKSNDSNCFISIID